LHIVPAGDQYTARVERTPRSKFKVFMSVFHATRTSKLQNLGWKSQA